MEKVELLLHIHSGRDVNREDALCVRMIHLHASPRRPESSHDASLDCFSGSMSENDVDYLSRTKRQTISCTKNPDAEERSDLGSFRLRVRSPSEELVHE